MKLVVVSHKPCWPSAESPSGYATDGGFPAQMRVISELFDQTTLVVPVYTVPAPESTMPLAGHNLSVFPLDLPRGVGQTRRWSLIPWIPRNLPRIWRAVHRAEAVHTPIPGDIGLFGVLFSLLQRKRLFIRHCGAWHRSDRFILRLYIWLLERIAGEKNVVFATGGDEQAPSQRNPAIRWIFSTTMSAVDMKAIPPKEPWHRDHGPLRLITVARQEPGKNTDQTIRALPALLEHYPDVMLDVVGNGTALPALKQLATELRLSERVIFHGYLNREGVMNALSRSHIFCFPTESEGFPKAVHEALAWGLPVVSTPVSVLSSLISDQNGILLDDTEPETIAAAVKSLMADELRLAEMVRNTQATAQKYSLECWRDSIGETLRAAWKEPLREHE